MLKHFGVEPLVVLDGGPLPSKEGTENEREKYAGASNLIEHRHCSDARLSAQ